MNKVYYISSNDSLYHHGIKGQKWGIRRYQNEDGSLTPEGERRYGTVENMNRTRSRNKNIAIGVGAAAAVAGTAYLVGKNRKLKRSNKALGKDNDALHDAAKILAGRNKGLKGENARLKDSLNRFNNKLLESGKEIDSLERQGSILVDKLTVSNQQTKKWQTKFNQLRKDVTNRAHVSALKENATRTKKSISMKKYHEGVRAKKASGLVKKVINTDSTINVTNNSAGNFIGDVAKKVSVWVKDTK